MKKHLPLLLLLFLLLAATRGEAGVIENPKFKAPNSSVDITPIDAIRGNWFDAAKGNWALGVYDSVVIANNRIYTTTRVLKRGKKIEFTLRDKQSGQTETLRLITRHNGTCQLTRGTEKTMLTRQADQLKITPDNGYDNFFHPATATIQGYIDGYNPSLGFKTGIVYVNNDITKEDLPTVVQIFPDGTFTCELPLQNPVALAIGIHEIFLPFFIEPGQTQTIYINWEDILALSKARDRNFSLYNIQYMGDNAHMSYLEHILSREITYNDYASLRDDPMKLTPMQFREKIQPSVDRWYQVADSLSAIYQASQKAVKRIRCTAALMEGILCFNFERDRLFLAMQHQDNEALKVKAGDDFYEFLRRMPIDEPEMLATREAGEFINRFEFAIPFWTRYPDVDDLSGEDYDKCLFHDNIRIDSLCQIWSGKDNPFLRQLCRLYGAKGYINNYLTNKYKQAHLDYLKQQTAEPVLIARLQDFCKTQEGNISKTYALPEGKATDIFRKIIRKHPGKVLYVDFWSTGCGPCRANIESESSVELRTKYKDHPEFEFIFITSDRESPREAYDQYVEKNLKGEATYRLPHDEYVYLRQLFKFNGIPHYEMVNKDGSIFLECEEPHNLKLYLDKHFPLNK